MDKYDYTCGWDTIDSFMADHKRDPIYFRSLWDKYRNKEAMPEFSAKEITLLEENNALANRNRIMFLALVSLQSKFSGGESRAIIDVALSRVAAVPIAATDTLEARIERLEKHHIAVAKQSMPPGLEGHIANLEHCTKGNQLWITKIRELFQGFNET